VGWAFGICPVQNRFGFAEVYYIGKEADQIEQTEILGVDDESYMEYRRART